MGISAENCSETIRQYDAQGWHRTATAVDEESAQWLCERLRALGIEGEEVPFGFERLDPARATVEVAGRVYEAVPLPDSVLPSPGTVIEGRCSGAGTAGSIAVMRIDQHRDEAALGEARAAGHEALVVCVEGDPDGHTLLNAWRFHAPYGPPVLQLPIGAWPDMERAQSRGDSIRITCGATRLATEAINVRGTVRGTETGLAPLVVLTPRSGWWHCAGERGGGIAVWLELARILASQPLRRDFVFLATTAHELGYLGARRFLEQDPPFAKAALAWLHLGANIGASGAGLVVRACNDELLRIAREADCHPARALQPRFEVTGRPAGEAAIVAEFGGRWISLIGPGYPLFHSTNDRWPVSLDETATVQAGELSLEALRSLDKASEPA